MDYYGFLEKGYGLLATILKDYGLFLLHFKIMDYWSLLHQLFLHKKVLNTPLPPVRSLFNGQNF